MDKGDIFDRRYRILDVVGQGGMSKVYAAENIKLGTRWAIKEINKTGCFKIDFLAEPNILKKLNHPALPRIFDIIDNDTNMYLIVDYIEGTSLLHKLENEDRIKEDLVLEWARQLCEVLNYLHSQKPHPIIYRDMKPSNIMLRPDGSLVLIDFGIAREYKPESENDTVFIGTRGYAAPEQYGAGQTNCATDIYSLGITLYHLLTGKSPNIMPHDIKPLRIAYPELSYETERIIEKCIRLDPKERYQSAAELLEELNRKQYANDNNKRINYSSRYKSIKRQLISIPDNCEFACELGYVLAKQSDLKILLVDICSPVSRSDIFLPLKNNHHQPGTNAETTLSELLGKEAVNKNEFEKLCRSCSGAGNLFILQVPPVTLSDVQIWLQKLRDFCYWNYDITIFLFDWANVNSIRNLLLGSDFVIVSAVANTDILRVCETNFLLLTKKMGLDMSNFRFIAYDYKKGISASASVQEKIFGRECVMTPVAYSAEKEKCRNIKAYYCEDNYGELQKEYAEIVGMLGIIQKKSVRDLLLDYFYKK